MNFAAHNLSKAADARQSGVIGLLTVVVLGALILTLGLSAAIIGQTQIFISGSADRGQAARAQAEACLDEALQRLKLNASFTAAVLPFGADSCAVTVSGSGAFRTVHATSSSGGYSKGLTAVVSLRQSPGLTARAWHLDRLQEDNP